jgi:hypothetical protein
MLVPRSPSTSLVNMLVLAQAWRLCSYPRGSCGYVRTRVDLTDKLVAVRILRICSCPARPGTSLGGMLVPVRILGICSYPLARHKSGCYARTRADLEAMLVTARVWWICSYPRGP